MIGNNSVVVGFKYSKYVSAVVKASDSVLVGKVFYIKLKISGTNMQAFRFDIDYITVKIIAK